MTGLILSLALAAQILPTPASVRWDSISVDGGESAAIDPSSVQRDGSLIRFLIRVDAHDSGPGTEIQLLIMRMALDCGRDEIGIEVADGYGASGSLIGSRASEVSEVEYEPVGEFAAGTAVRILFCQGSGDYVLYKPKRMR